jgi:hypothetical protein
MLKILLFLLFNLNLLNGTFVSNSGSNVSNIKYTFVINNYYNDKLQKILICDEKCCKVENETSWNCNFECCKVLEEKNI